MAANYIDAIATELWKLNNEQLTIDHYKYYVYAGLESQIQQLYPQSVIDGWKEKYDESNGNK